MPMQQVPQKEKKPRSQAGGMTLDSRTEAATVSREETKVRAEMTAEDLNERV